MREKLKIYNKRRIVHWFEILQALLKKISFPSLMMLFDREEIHIKEISMLQMQTKDLMESNSQL